MITALALLIVPLLTKDRTFINVSAVLFGMFMGMIEMNEGINFLGLFGFPRMVLFGLLYLLFAYHIAYGENMLDLLKPNTQTVIHGFYTKSKVTKEKLKNLIGHDIVFLNDFEGNILYRVDVFDKKEADKVAKFISSKSFLNNFSSVSDVLIPVTNSRFFGSFFTFLYTCSRMYFYVVNTFFVEPIKKSIQIIFNVWNTFFVFIAESIKTAWGIIIYPLKSFNDTVESFSNWGSKNFLNYMVLWVTNYTMYFFFQIQEMINDFTGKLGDFFAGILHLDIIPFDRKNYIFA
jgi:hypothetical protein